MIYFITAEESGYPVKIGYTGDRIEKRLSSIQTGNPNHLICIFFMDGGIDVEHKIHEKLSSKRVHGEWFERSSAIDLMISDYSASMNDFQLTKNPPLRECKQDSIREAIGSSRFLLLKNSGDLSRFRLGGNLAVAACYPGTLSELCCLKKDDFDLENSRIMYRGAPICLNEDIVPLLKTFFESDLHGGEYALASERGREFSGRGVQKLLKKVVSSGFRGLNNAVREHYLMSGVSLPRRRKVA